MNRISNKEYFEALGTIQAGMWMLGRILKELEVRNPIETMIDDATEYEKGMYKDALDILKEIKDAQIKIGEDWSDTQKAIDDFERVVNRN